MKPARAASVSTSSRKTTAPTPPFSSPSVWIQTSAGQSPPSLLLRRHWRIGLSLPPPGGLSIVLRLFLVSRSPPLAGHLAGRSARPPAASPPPSQPGFRGRPQRWGQPPAPAASRHVSRAVGDHSGPPAGREPPRSRQSVTIADLPPVQLAPPSSNGSEERYVCYCAYKHAIQTPLESRCSLTSNKQTSRQGKAKRKQRQRVSGQYQNYRTL